MSDMTAYPADFAATPAIEPPRSGFFFGANGLRAGWGILMFALLLGIIFMALNLGAQIGALLHPDAYHHVGSALYQPRTQIGESLLYMLAVIASAIMLARRGPFAAGKTLAAALLLVASCGLITASIVHFNRVQKMLAADNQNAQTTNATPVAQPAANAQIQQGKAIGAEAVTFGIVLLITWLMSRIEHRRFGEYGLGGNRRRWPQLGQGALTGFGALSVLILFLYLGHWITFGGALLHSPGAVLENGFLWLIAFILVGFFEEFFFRGYLQFTLARGIGLGAIGFFIAAALFNFGFGFGHGNNPGESPIGLWSAGLIGFVFCISLWYTRSLWWAIGFHATWDWGESYFYGTADSGGVSQGRLFDTHPQGKLLLSGGPTGPEGSVMCLCVIALIALFIWVTLHRERNKSTNQALVNPLVDPLVPPLAEPVA
jgi:membrane protease YdiL (CAAX protease family)